MEPRTPIAKGDGKVRADGATRASAESKLNEGGVPEMFRSLLAQTYEKKGAAKGRIVEQETALRRRVAAMKAMLKRQEKEHADLHEHADAPRRGAIPLLSDDHPLKGRAKVRVSPIGEWGSPCCDFSKPCTAKAKAVRSHAVFLRRLRDAIAFANHWRSTAAVEFNREQASVLATKISMLRFLHVEHRLTFPEIAIFLMSRQNPQRPGFQEAEIAERKHALEQEWSRNKGARARSGK